MAGATTKKEFRGGLGDTRRVHREFDASVCVKDQARARLSSGRGPRSVRRDSGPENCNCPRYHAKFAAVTVAMWSHRQAACALRLPAAVAQPAETTRQRA